MDNLNRINLTRKNQILDGDNGDLISLFNEDNRKSLIKYYLGVGWKFAHESEDGNIYLYADDTDDNITKKTSDKNRRSMWIMFYLAWFISLFGLCVYIYNNS